MLLGYSFEQTNLLVNSGFEDINTCTEYNSECGVEGWFYLADVKAQMLENKNTMKNAGKEFLWHFYKLEILYRLHTRKGNTAALEVFKKESNIFLKVLSPLHSIQTDPETGICLGEKFFVPKRPFSKELKLDTISNITAIPKSNFFRFEYRFTKRWYREISTFGTYVYEDTTGAKRNWSAHRPSQLYWTILNWYRKMRKKQYARLFELNKKPFIITISGTGKWTIRYMVAVNYNIVLTIRKTI